MNTKLTLKLDDFAIQNAKNYAFKKGISLSKLVENFFNSLEKNKTSENKDEYSTIVNELTGIISLPNDYDYKTDYVNYLEEKYE